jgi:hypothetical protein
VTDTPKKEPIEKVFDAIEESIVNASEADLRADVEAAGENFSTVARDVRETFAHVQKEQRQSALAAARAGYAQASKRSTSVTLPTTPGARKALLGLALARHPELTAQFRDFGGMSDADIQSALEDLSDLGKLEGLEDE